MAALLEVLEVETNINFNNNNVNVTKILKSGSVEGLNSVVLIHSHWLLIFVFSSSSFKSYKNAPNLIYTLLHHPSYNHVKTKVECKLLGGWL